MAIPLGLADSGGSRALSHETVAALLPPWPFAGGERHLAGALRADRELPGLTLELLAESEGVSEGGPCEGL